MSAPSTVTMYLASSPVPITRARMMLAGSGFLPGSSCSIGGSASSRCFNRSGMRGDLDLVLGVLGLVVLTLLLLLRLRLRDLRRPGLRSAMLPVLVFRSDSSWECSQKTEKLSFVKQLTCIYVTSSHMHGAQIMS